MPVSLTVFLLIFCFCFAPYFQFNVAVVCRLHQLFCSLFSGLHMLRCTKSPQKQRNIFQTHSAYSGRQEYEKESNEIFQDKMYPCGRVTDFLFFVMAIVMFMSRSAQNPPTVDIDLGLEYSTIQKVTIYCYAMIISRVCRSEI